MPSSSSASASVVSVANAWTRRRGVVAAALVVAALAVAASVVALGFYRPRYVTVVTDLVGFAVEAIDGDADPGPLIDVTLGDLTGIIGGGEGDGDAAVPPLFDPSTLPPAPAPSSPEPTEAPTPDPCADVPRNRRNALSLAAQTVLAAYSQVHAQQLEWLRAGDPRFRAVLYQCTANAACGGLGDRLNGVVSAFYLAVLTQRAFFIEITTPVPFELFFLPSGSIDWRWPPEGWDAFPQRSIASLDAIDYYNPLEAQLRWRGGNPLVAVDAAPTLIIFHTNLQFWMDITASAEYVEASPLYPFVRPVRDSGELYNLAIAALLRPTCFLAQATRTWETTLFGAYGPAVPRIGVHLRTGLDPDFHDVHRFQPEHLSNFAKNLPAAVAKLRALAPLDAAVNATVPPVVFVVADYPPAIDLMLEQLRGAGAGTWTAVVTVPLSDQLPLTHLERTTLGAIHTPEGNLRTFLEWNLLRKMDMHVIGRTGYSMSASRTVCQPVLYFPKINTPVADYLFYPRGMCWPQERPADEG